ncbi:MAG: PhoH family protein [Saprospiraceae bacterium]|nr:PhoH family protein [Saprospiraceae bacterium]
MFLSEIILNLEGIDLVELYGENNAKLNILRKAFPDVTVTSRGHQLKIKGTKKGETQDVKAKIEQMIKMLKEQKELTLHTVEDLVRGENPYEVRLSNGSSNAVIVFGKDGSPIKAKTRNQKRLVDAIETNDIVFAIGPAGTGKTYTAVAMAVRALKNKMVKKIILTRPAVEAGENLGFLPGDLKDKIDPYLRPLYDALDDMFPAEKLAQFMTNRVIEIAPLAFMRGRTLNDAFIILDEAQNTTTQQMKMFLTRLGPNAKAVVTGDLTQIDLPGNVRSGLRQSMYILEGIDGIAQIYLNADDVVRHRLVKDIIRAYDVDDERRRAEKNMQKEQSEQKEGKEQKEPPVEEQKLQVEIQEEAQNGQIEASNNSVAS